MSELPQGWRYVKLGDLAEYLNGAAFKPQDWGEEGIPIIRIQNLTDPQKPMNRTLKPVNESLRVQDGDILVSWSATLDAFIWDRGEAWLNQHIFRVLPRKNVVHKGYLFFLLKNEIAELIKTEHLHGSTMKHINRGPFLAHTVPLPPLSEQRRIVAILDALLSKSKAARRELAAVAALAKRQRQAVLGKAFSGELTRDLKSNIRLQITDPFSMTFKAPDDWKETTIDGICQLVGGSQPPKSVFKYSEESGYIRLIQIRDYKSDNFKTYIPIADAKRKCSTTDVMIGRYGPPIFQILRGIEGAYNVALMKAVPRDNCSNNFLFWRLQDPALLRYVEVGSDRTAGQDGVNKTHLLKYPIFLPSLAEQREIVRRIEAAFARIETMEREAQRAAELLGRLEQATLAKAFRGEL